MKFGRRETTIEDCHGPVHVIEFVIRGEENRSVKAAEYMEKQAAMFFHQIGGDRFVWGCDWDDSDCKEGHGETTFYLEARPGSIGEAVTKANDLFREAKRQA